MSRLIPGIPNADYHASDGISSSQLKLALKCPAHYRASLEGQLPKKSTPSMDLGTAVHTLVLEPEHAERDLVVARKFGRSKADQAAKAEFETEHEGKTLLSQDQYDDARRMAENLLSLTDAANILSDGTNELSGWYTDEDTGLDCKYRPDCRTDYCIADVKTCIDASPDGFARSMAQFDYPLSAAHYLAGDEQLTGTDHRQFVFLCVENKPPYLPAVYVLSQEDLDIGHRQRRKALNTIRICEDINLWPTYNDGTAQVIKMPRWAENKYMDEERYIL